MNDNNKWKRVETEAEYWVQHKEMKKDIKKLFRSSYKMMNDPEGFIKKYEILLTKYVFIGVVSEEWADEQRIRLFKEMNSPNEFKEWVEKAKDNLKNNKDKITKKIKNLVK